MWLSEHALITTASEYGGEYGKRGEFCPSIPPKTVLSFETGIMNMIAIFSKNADISSAMTRPGGQVTHTI